MDVGATTGMRGDAIAALVSEERHVLVFELGANAIDANESRPRRFDVRLVGTLPRAGDRIEASRGDDFAAVLVLPALTPARLLSCLRALTGARATSASGVAAPAERSIGRAQRALPRSLTSRELDVLRLLASGASTRDMALELCYSERTVKTIVHDLLAKLGCRTRAQAAAMAARQGVI